MKIVNDFQTCKTVSQESETCPTLPLAILVSCGLQILLFFCLMPEDGVVQISDLAGKVSV